MSTSLNTQLTRDCVKLRDDDGELQWLIIYKPTAPQARQWGVYRARDNAFRGAWFTLEAAEFSALAHEADRIDALLTAGGS